MQLKMLVTLSVCAGIYPWSAKGKTTIGLAVSTMQNPFFETLTQGAQSEAKKHGIELVVKDSKNSSVAEAANIEALSKMGVHLLLLNPTDREKVLPSVLKMNETKIPIVTLDRGVAGGDIVSHIASNNVDGGAMAASYLLEHLGNKGDIVELEGIRGTSAAMDRGRGFNEKIRSSNLKIIAHREANFDQGEARSVFTKILSQNPRIDAVFAHNDEMIIGAYKAAQALKREKEMLFVGFDAIEIAVQMVKDGALAATIAQDPYEIGRKGVEIAVQVLAGTKAEREYSVPLKVVQRK